MNQNQPEQNQSNIPPDNSDPAQLIHNKKIVLADVSHGLAAAACYFPVVLNLVAPLALLFTEPKESRFVRYHAVQGLLLLVATTLIVTVIGTVGAIFEMMPFLSLLAMAVNLLNGVIYLAYFGICVRLLLQVYSGKPGKLPIVSQYIEQAMDTYNL